MKKLQFLFLAFSGTLLIYSYASYQISKKQELTAASQRELAIAVQSIWIDDCGGIIPEQGVDMPNGLTTPISYTTSQYTQDPFGKSNERLLFLPEKYFANSGAFAIISRGPDGDLDSKRAPHRTLYEEKMDEEVMTLPSFDQSESQTKEEMYLNWFAEQGIHQYDPSNGMKSDGDLIRIYF